MSKITISTVGNVDGLRLAEKVHEPGWHRLNLAVSLNAHRRGALADHAGQPQVVDGRSPRGDPGLADLRRAKICFEYVLIPGSTTSASTPRRSPTLSWDGASTPASAGT